MRSDEIRKHLKRYLVSFAARMQSDVVSCGFEDQGAVNKINRAVCTGLICNVARLCSDGKYRTLRNDILIEVDRESVIVKYSRSPGE